MAKSKGADKGGKGGKPAAKGGKGAKGGGGPQAATKEKREKGKAKHPAYAETTITCGCGNVITTRSTGKELSTEVCSSCHPFYTGKQKLVDTAGRIEKFQRRYANIPRPPAKKKPKDAEQN